MDLNISNVGVNLPNKYSQLALKKGMEYSVPPSMFICQWWFESRFGTTNVAKSNNNWGGTSWFYKGTSYKRPSGVTAYRGTKRPAREGAYYMKFNNIDDYMIDYFYLILESSNYNVKGHNNWEKCIRGLFREGGAKNSYAASGLGHYLSTMNGIRNGINKRNDNILDKIDKDPKAYYDGSIKPQKPTDPIPTDPPPEGELAPSEVVDSYDTLSEKVFNTISKMINFDLFNFDLHGKTFGNSHIKIIKQMDNMYKVIPTKSFKEVFKGDLVEGLDNMEDTLQGTNGRPKDPAPEDTEIYFPVDPTREGINFWKRSKQTMGTTPYEMCYGWTRNKGNKFHSGYDIGGGGKTDHKVYATTTGIVNFIKWSDSGGYMIQIKHTTDDYYSTYMHLKNESATVKEGQEVKAGEQIAIMGNTPNYAIHLHYVLSKDGTTFGEDKTFNPESYLRVTDNNKTLLKIPE